MRISQRAQSLSELSGGTLNSGVVPWTRISREIVRGENAAAITVTNADTLIKAISLGAVSNLDFILLWGQAEMGGGAAVGDKFLGIRKNSGTATVEFLFDLTFIGQRIVLAEAGGTHLMQVCGGCMVTGDGNLVVELFGNSQNSNATVAIGQGQIVAQVLYGS